MTKEIKIGFVGDFCLAKAHLRPRAYIENAYDVSSKLNDQVDLAIANHEFCIVPPESRTVGGMGLPAEYAGDVNRAGFDVFCLANNHIGDFGNRALLHTRDFLERNGHKTVGVGKDVDEAIEPLFLESSGFRIAVVNFCDATQYAAKKNSAGLAHIEMNLLRKAILKAKKNADIVIVVLHADLEFTNYPSPARAKLSRQLAKLGVDLIIQHHPHVLQGIEYCGETLIAYSLGNYIFPVSGPGYGDQYIDKTSESVYLSVHIKEDSEGVRTMSYEIIPLQIDKEDNVCFPSDEKSEEINANMKSFSEALNDAPFLRHNYHKFCRMQMFDLVTDSYYRTAKQGFVAGFKYIKKHFATKSHTNWMRGFFTFGRY